MFFRRTIAILTAVVLVLSGGAPLLSAGSQTDFRTGSAAVLRLCEEGVLADGHVGVMAVRMGSEGRTGQGRPAGATGTVADTIALYNAGQCFTPASNLKLLTTGAALRTFGPDFRFQTSLAYSGHIDQDGVLHGDIYIIGGGDPTLGAKYESSPAIETVFGKWRTMMTEAGIRSVDGCIVGDGRLFDDCSVNADRSVEDIGFYYGAPAHALNFHENSIDFSVYPGTAVGADLTLDQVFPPTPWLDLSTPCTTGEAGTGDRLLYEASTLIPMAAMTGTLAIDRKVAHESVVNHFPEYTCAEAFCSYLEGDSLRVSGGAADIGPGGVLRNDLILYDDNTLAVSRDSLTILGQTLSPALSAIILETNHESDNFYADALLKAFGLRFGGSSAYPVSLESMQAVLSDILAGKSLTESAGGLAGRGVQLRDGSGLSRRNFLTPAFMVEFLQVMARGPYFDTYLQSIPQPGRGTLSARLRNAPDSVRLYMKSGSMDGVRCFSGYILPSGISPSGSGAGAPDGTIAFAIFTNDVTGSSSAAYSAIDRIIIELTR